MELQKNERALKPMGIFQDNKVVNLNAIQLNGLNHDFNIGTSQVVWSLLNITEESGSPGNGEPGTIDYIPGVPASYEVTIIYGGSTLIPADTIAGWNGNDDVIFTFVTNAINLPLAV